MLAAFGLETTHETIYREMLESPALGVGDIALRLEIDPDQVRACLDKLFELRLVQESFEAPGCFVAVDPVMSLQQLLARQHDELIERQRWVAESQAMVMRMLAGTASRPTPGPGVERLEGMDVVQRRLEQLALEASREVLTFMPGGPQSLAALTASRRNDAQALACGVTIRTIGLDSVHDDAATLQYTRWLTDQGGEFRIAVTLPPRMILIDGNRALVPIDPANTRKGALCLSDPGMIVPLVALFEQTWALSVPLGADQHPDRDTLSDQERALLTLIAQGHTDASAANQLHVSSRTARRMMASVMERLGARSRFEAGLKAAQQGWL